MHSLTISTGRLCAAIVACSAHTLTAAQPTTLIGHRQPVVDVEFSPDGTQLASIAQDGETIVWDLKAGTGQWGPGVQRSLETGESYLQFTRADPPRLLAGCDQHGFVLDPPTAQPVTEWGSAESTRANSPLRYVGGQRFVSQRTSVMDAGQPSPLYTVGNRSPPLCAISPDGQRWFTNHNIGWGNDKQVQVLNAATGQVQCDLSAFTSAVRGIAWAGTNRVLTLVEGGTLLLWDVSGTGKLLAKLDVPGAWRLAVSADGQTAALALKQNKLAVLRIGDKQMQVGPTLNAALYGDHEPTFALSANGAQVLAASPSDNRWQLAVFDAQSGQELLVHSRNQSDAPAELSPSGDYVAVGHADGKISLLPVNATRSGPADGPLTQILDLPLEQPAVPGIAEGFRSLYRPYSVGRLVLSAHGEVLAVARGRSNQVASVARGQADARHLPVWEQSSTRPDTKELPTWALLPNGTFLVEGTIIGTERIPNFVSGRVDPATGQFQLQRQSRSLQYTGMQPSPDGKVMAVRAGEWKWTNNQRQQLPPSLLLLDMQTGQTLHTLATDLEASTPCLMTFSNTGQRLAVLERWKLRVFDTDSGDELPLVGDWRSEHFWFLAGGQILARQTSDGAIVGVDLDSQSELFRWQTSAGQSGQVSAIDMSLDGALAAIGGSTGDLTLRDPRTGGIKHRLQAFDKPIAAIGISPDGTILAAADEQRRLIAWKLGPLDTQPQGAPAATLRVIRVSDADSR